MAEHTHISWADDTFNPWIGCTKVGPACDGCYADALMGQNGRYKRATWGGPGQRAVLSKTAPSTWKMPLKWEREAAADRLLPLGDRRWPAGRFVFCASLADVFDKDADPAWRRELFDLIRATPNLTWLLLTKRPQNIVKMFVDTVEDELGAYADETGFRSQWPRNAAIGCTIVTQAEANRDVPHLANAATWLKVPFAFLSMEPLLEEVDLTNITTLQFRGAEKLNALTGVLSGVFGDYCPTRLTPIGWVISGRETDQGGHEARPTPDGPFLSLARQCDRFGTPYHHKQNGEWVEVASDEAGRAHLENPRSKRKTAEADGVPMIKIGKHNSGRRLLGEIYDARPTPQEYPHVR